MMVEMETGLVTGVWTNGVWTARFVCLLRLRAQCIPNKRLVSCFCIRGNILCVYTLNHLVRSTLCYFDPVRYNHGLFSK